MTQPVVRVAFLDVGQGDTIVVSVPETREAVVVDCVDADAVLRYLEYSDIKYLRGVIITHLHLDHCSGIIGLLDNVQSELGMICEMLLCLLPRAKSAQLSVLLKDADGHSDANTGPKDLERQRKDVMGQLLRWSKLNYDRFKSLTRETGRTFPLPGIIDLIHPYEADVPLLIGNSLNDTSGVLIIRGSGSTALLPGDLESPGWQCLKQNHRDIKSDVLKFPHHGAWSKGDPLDILDTIDPSVVVISVGTNGVRYGHPNSSVLRAVTSKPGRRVLCTQGTTLCSKSVEAKRDDIINKFKTCPGHDQNFTLEHGGCPCAGTVIVDLGESPKVIQPSADFHQYHILLPYYPDHCC
ncbi:MAG: MBL fold metallo-hydrolase [Dehalococcoidia bacterium]